MKKILLQTLLILLLFSCTKPEKNYQITEENGIQTIINNGKPNNSNLKIELEEVMTIQGFDDVLNPDENSFFNVLSLQVSDDEEIFLKDYDSNKIFKYSKEGTFIKKFSGKGEGPGEVELDGGKHYIVDNKIVITGNFLHWFDLVGNFIKRELVTEVRGFSINLVDLGDKEYLNYQILLDLRGDNRDNDFFLVSNIVKNSLIDDTSDKLDVKMEANFYDIFHKDIPEGFLYHFALTNSENLIYLAKRSRDEYLIDCYDFDLKKVQTIKKDSKSSKYSDSEMDKIKEQFPANNFYKDFYDLVFDKKLCFNNLHYDNESDYLFVEHTPDLDKRIIVFDVFKEGVYQNSFDFSIKEDDYQAMNREFNFLFKNGKMYYYSQSENKVVIYKINYLQ